MSSPWNSVGCVTWGVIVLVVSGGLQMVGLGGQASMVVGVLAAFAVVWLIEWRNRRARIEEMREAQRPPEDWRW